MASAREYFRSRQNELYSEEYQTNLRRHRQKVLRTALISVAVIVAACLILYLYNRNHAYKSYDLLKKVESEDNQNSHFVRMSDLLLCYNMDGVWCYDKNFKLLWNQSFEMKAPMLDICGSYAAICDTGGTHIYILDKNGLNGEVDTQLPIKRVEVAEQGVVAALVEEGDINRINYYDHLGTLLAENKAPIQDSGYLMDISLSNDGLKMGVSYMSLETGSINTKVAFYNFDAVGANEIDHLVSAQEYKAAVVPEIEFVNSTTAVVFGDGFFDIFQGSQKPQERFRKDFDEEIQSVFYSESNIGVIIESTGKHPYVLKIYDLSGKECLSLELDTTFEKVKLKKNNVYLINGAQCMIYNFNGKLKFDGDFKEDLVEIIPIDDDRLILVGNDALQMVKLR